MIFFLLLIIFVQSNCWLDPFSSLLNEPLFQISLDLVYNNNILIEKAKKVFFSIFNNFQQQKN